MQNWYCRVHFPDGTERVHLVPGPAPVYSNASIQLADKPGLWFVLEITVHVPADEDYAAEIWVRPATAEDLSGEAGEKIG